MWGLEQLFSAFIEKMKNNSTENILEDMQLIETVKILYLYKGKQVAVGSYNLDLNN